MGRDSLDGPLCDVSSDSPASLDCAWEQRHCRPPINAFLLAQHLPDAQLVMYPDASHGAQSQHAEVFLEHARLFLNE
jgi:pimeloyl-ACP methyl ester carboxylesterase